MKVLRCSKTWSLKSKICKYSYRLMLVPTNDISMDSDHHYLIGHQLLIDAGMHRAKCSVLHCICFHLACKHMSLPDEIRSSCLHLHHEQLGHYETNNFLLSWVQQRCACCAIGDRYRIRHPYCV